MLGTIVDHLHEAHVPFRLVNCPSEEAESIGAHPIHGGGMLVDTRLLVVGGKAIIAVFPALEHIDLAAVSAALGGTAEPATDEELPAALQHSTGPCPPLGHLFGIPLVVDDRVALAARIVFRSFGESVYFEITYDDLSRLEQPRIASLVDVHMRTTSAA